MKTPPQSESIPAAAPKPARPPVEVCHESGFPFLDDAIVAARLADGWEVLTSFATISGHAFIYFHRTRSVARGR